MIRALWFGQITYQNGLRVQEFICSKLKSLGDSNNHFLCFFEHFPVYTVGVRERLYLKDEEERLKSLGADFFRVKRGGLITFHGPGQLVAYPIFNLKGLNLKKQNSVKFIGVRKFVDLIEQATIDLLINNFNILNVSRTKDSGVWVNDHKKIAAIGIQVSSGYTSHGLALNCNTDLRWFNNIVPCGLEGKYVTSITQEVGLIVEVKDILDFFCKSFESTFQIPVNLIKPIDFNPNDVDKYLNSDSFNKLIC